VAARLLTISQLIFSAQACGWQSNDRIDRIGQAFSTRNFPWYSSETDSFREVGQGRSASQALSRDRGTMPLRKQKAQRLTPAPRPTNLNAGVVAQYLAWTFIIFALLIVGGILIWVFLKSDRLNSNSSVASAGSATRKQRIQQLPFLLEQGPTDLRSLAERAAQQNDFGRAITFLFSHVLVTLDEHHRIQLKKGKTNRQYLRELQTNSELAAIYRRLMLAFEDHFFGGHEISPARFEACWRELPAFEQFANQDKLLAIS
jgi:hypothetical protein